MDCLICFKIFIKEKEYENISPPKSDICARSICKLLEIPNSPRIQEIFKDPVICSKCYQKLEDVHKKLVQLEELERKIEEIRRDVQKDLENSINVSQVMQNTYGGEMSKSSKDRLEILEVIKNKPSTSAISTLQMDPQEIPIDQSATLPLSPRSKIISDRTTGKQLNIHATIPEIEIAQIQSPSELRMNLNEASRTRYPEDGIKMKGQILRRKYPEKIERTRKSKYSMHFYCKICKARYSSKSSLSNHMKKHSELKEMHIKPKEYLQDFNCTECGRPHSSEDELNVHLESVLTSTNIQKCSLCAEEFWGSQCLEYHKILHHSKELDSNCGIEKQKQTKSNYHPKIWECGVCKLKFSCNSKLITHQLIHGPKKFKCSFEGCGKKFHLKNKLKQHEFCHSSSEQKPFQCKYCFRGFVDKRNLISHLGEKKSEFCGICKEDFKSSGCLKHHNSISHGMSYYSTIKSAERRDLAKCKICSKYYLSKNLKLHELTHAEPKFKCPEIGCEKLFKFKVGMNEHIKIIHKGIRYKCKFVGCEKKFRQKSHMTHHVKIVHK